MPTGYTADLYDGKPQTFRQFALNASRAFGATIMQRDDPPGPPKLRVANHKYSTERLAQAREDLVDAQSWTDEEATVRASDDYIKAYNYWVEAEAGKAAKRERYEAMLEQVRAWTPPTKDHENYKQFMIDQLEESIRFDCSVWDRTINPVTGAEFKAQAISRAERDIEYYTEEIRKEIERTEAANAWITDLYESLPEEQ